MALPQKFLHAAGCLFAQECGEILTRSEKDEIAWSGLRADDAAVIADSLLANLRSGFVQDPAYRGRGWRALARRRGRVDLHFFRVALREELSRDHGVAWQLMLALEELGESVLAPERTGGALWQEEENRQDAMRYLAAALPPEE